MSASKEWRSARRDFSCSSASAIRAEPSRQLTKRVANGTRTRDHRDHNPGLYQLSYRHRARPMVSAPQKCASGVSSSRSRSSTSDS